MKALRSGVLAGLLCFGAPAALALSVGNSSWSVRVWQADAGLPNDNVSSIEQTDDGYLWVANHRRLARFDGVEFEGFPAGEILPGQTRRIGALKRSRDGGLWVAMDSGPVVYLKAGAATVYSNNVPQLTVRAILEDTDGAAWISYFDGGLCRIRQGEVRQFTSDDGVPPGFVCSMALDRDGRLWFSKGGHIGRIVEGRFETLFTVPNHRARVAFASAGGIWICSGYRLYHCDSAGKLSDLGAFAPELPNFGPSDLMEDRNGAVWIATSESGLFRFSGKVFENVPVSHRKVATLLEDRAGNIWAGTTGGGLNRITPRAIRLEHAGTGLPFETVRSVCEDRDGLIWAVTENGFVVTHCGNQWSTVSTNAGWPGPTMTCVAADRAGAVWIGSSSGVLYRWEQGRLTALTDDDGLEVRVAHLLLASRSGDVWIGGNPTPILQRLRAGEFTKVPLPKDLSRMTAIAEDLAGNIWVGTSRGSLLRVKGDRVVDETGLLAGGPIPVRALQAGADGGLWIGYAGGGLGYLRDGKLMRIGIEQGLFDNHISQIVADEAGWLWFGSDRGIFKARTGGLKTVMEEGSGAVQSIYHGRGEGLPSLQANFGYAQGTLRSGDGRLWMPMRTALAVIDPRRVGDEAEPPDVFIRRVTVDGRTEGVYGGPIPVRTGIDLKRVGGALRLAPEHHRLVFEFAAMAFRSPENVLFRYQLTGYDEDWNLNGADRSVTYSRLPAGRYEFRVSACNESGIWNEVPTVFAFQVMPFFWQTWWFRFAMLVALASAMAAVIRYASFRRLRLRLQRAERKAALERERSRIARDIHDDMGSRLTRIVLLSEMTLQKEATVEEAAERAQQVATAARQVMKSLDETVWAINPRNDTVSDLIDYLSQFAVEFLKTAEIRCRVELPETVSARVMPADVRHNLFLASKEALNNLVRHSGAREASLRVEFTDEILRITIEDRGSGFSGVTADGEADGLRNMRQRLEELGGECEIDSRPGMGTRVSFLYRWKPG